VGELREAIVDQEEVFEFISEVRKPS